MTGGGVNIDEGGWLFGDGHIHDGCGLLRDGHIDDRGGQVGQAQGHFDDRGRRVGFGGEGQDEGCEKHGGEQGVTQNS